MTAVSPTPDKRKCPKCGADDVLLIDMAADGETWELDPDVYDEFAEVWVCQNYIGLRLCGWNEEADPDEAMEYHMREIEWLSERIAQIQAAKP